MPGTPFNIADPVFDLDSERPRLRYTCFLAVLDPYPALYGFCPVAIPNGTVPGRGFGLPWIMAPATSPSPVSPLTARKTWRTVEPLHGMVYFAPEASASYIGLGLKPEAGYFASRSAAMGAVGADTVIATFYNFDPRLVRAAIPEAWSVTSPAAVLEARLQAADGALRRMLGGAVDSPEMVRAAGLARRAAERAALRYEGRPLFAAHAGLAWPEPPHLMLWHAQTLLREFRGDGHIAVLVQHDLGPVEALVLHLASGELPGTFLRDSRGWSDAAWDAGVDRLRRRGLLEPEEIAGADGSSLALSPQGVVLRNEMEDATDRLAVFPYEALGEEECSELRTLARPFSQTVVEAAGLRA
jgi:hypothetical protein